MYKFYRSTDENDMNDPVSRPHYPPRPLRAARPVYAVVEQANEEPQAKEREGLEEKQ